MTRITSRLFMTVADQLGNPHGILGKFTANALNRGNQALISAAVAAAAPSRGATAADIGFGGGVGLTELLGRVGPDGTVYGIDPSTDMRIRATAQNAKAIEGGQLQIADGGLLDLPLPNASLDAAITTNTIYFVADLPAACTELARVTHPSGVAVVGIADPDAMAKLPVTEYGFTLRPVDEVVETLKGAGFTVDVENVTGGKIPQLLLVCRKA
ncbi:methyltransferase domain-containing protein [Nocardia camponoti]|uniref:Methyltransferase type 11 domain-containing protein n=1 Tax=Nocardia camponoti TaxID=1616106 RepID=A0A917VA72_9NOCA|nr:methyltransferase domain-containing protein [Nocardia camponoti]GGK54941.1 hypothetical protein GCM10011591_28530 [Nocardia camponoti]